MREEISSGGVVVFDKSILLLRKFNGDWVLPKGRVEQNEELADAALREVFEEAGARAEIIKYLGEIHYTYQSAYDTHERIHKIVHWYMMRSQDQRLKPQREEGFVEAKYIGIDRIVDLLKYDDEREIVKVVVESLKKED